MSILVRFGRRLAKRLYGLSSRQLIGLLLITAVCSGVAAASATGHVAVASSLLGVLLGGTLAGVVLLSRRIGGLHRAEQASIRDLRTLVEQLQRRVVAAVEKERLASGDRHQELVETIVRTERLTPAGAEQLLREQTRDMESLIQLFQHLTPRAPMPPADSTPTDLLDLMHMVRSRKPKLAVVLGAGPSAVWLGYALAKGSRLVVVEQNADRATQIRSTVSAHGLTGVEVVHAPPAELSVDGRTVHWYDVDALDGLQEIDLLVADGPASSDAVAAALHVLGRRLAEDAEVVVEDGPRAVPRQPGAGRWTALSYARTMEPAAS